MAGAPGTLRCPECGHQARTKPEMHRTRRRKAPAALGFVIAGSLPSFMLYQHAVQAGWVYLLLPKWKVLSSAQVRGFSVQSLEVRNPSAKDWSRKLRIQRQGDTLLEIPGFYFTIGAPVISNNVKKTIGLGDDITGDGTPNLVIIEDFGGSGCMMTVYVFGLDASNPGPGLWPIAVLHNCGRFEDVDGDGKYEFIAGENTYAYEWTSGGDSPRPEVILRYIDGRYIVAIDLMRKPVPSHDQLIARLHSFAGNNKPWSEQNWPTRFSALLHVTLDLIYTGHEATAWEFFQEQWPDGDGPYTKNAFAADLKQTIAQSPFAAEIRALNAQQ